MVGRASVRIPLLALEVFVGVGAVVGGIGVATSGIGLPLGWLEGSPFRSYVVPGLVLLVVVGGSQFAAATAVWRRREWGTAASLVAGLILVGWISVQVVIIGLRSWLQPFYLVVGLLIVGLAAAQSSVVARPRHNTRNVGDEAVSQTHDERRTP